MVNIVGKSEFSWVWWHKIVIPELGRWRQEDPKFKTRFRGDHSGNKVLVAQA